MYHISRNHSLHVFKFVMLLNSRRSGGLALIVSAGLSYWLFLYAIYPNSTTVNAAKASSLQRAFFSQLVDQDIRHARTFMNRTATSNTRIRLEEKILPNGVLHFTRILDDAEPDLLWLTLTYDSSSWGKEKGPNFRTFTDFLDIVTSQHEAAKTSIGILTSSLDEYHLYKSVIHLYNFSRVIILMQPGSYSHQVVDRAHRHDEDVQAERRAELAKLRNYLMLKALQEEQHILWTDADTFEFSHGIVGRMLRHIHTHEDVGVLTARCALTSWRSNYDHNAWRGTRKGPRGWDLTEEEIKNGEQKLQGEHLVGELIRGTTNDDLVPLDSVGGTILYIRASLVLLGLNFPYQYVIGTRWGKDGWDGLETEGICYMARSLKGGKCMLLGGDWHVLHTKY